MSERRMSICVCTAVPATVNAFLLRHIKELAQHHDVTVISDFIQGQVSLPAGAKSVSVPIARKISPWSDLRALAQLVAVFRRHRFDLVLSVTPKAGLLASIAGRLTGVPVRMHWFTGQVWVNRQGIFRRFLKAADCVIAGNVTHALVDSASQQGFLLREGVVPASRTRVLADGSICGVDAVRFRPDADARQEVREQHGVPLDSCLILFLGRLNRDKGVMDLVRAFAALARQRGDCHLMLVGSDEEGLLPQVHQQLQGLESRYTCVDFTQAPQRFMAAADVFCLPSYREGFGSVIIEAAACGVPAVATRIYGLTDAVVEGETGLLFTPGNVDELEHELSCCVEEPNARRIMGDAARERALRLFPAARVTRELVAYCDFLLGKTEKNAEADF